LIILKRREFFFSVLHRVESLSREVTNVREGEASRFGIMRYKEWVMDEFHSPFFVIKINDFERIRFFALKNFIEQVL
jgi:hypothetical protein